MSALPHHYDIIRRPVITEKSTQASAANAVVFEAAMDADKGAIKEAVEALFNVKVQSVNVLIAKGKRVRFRGRPGKRRDSKKAYVRLVEGYTIDVTAQL
ncbi:MAG: 50S ribosomal protein L23 [Rhodobacteraceae bacterium]|nr:50S ribosomal protein L23 [Paracoccaceae bacterium]